MFNEERSVAMPAAIHRELQAHLVREDGQEDLAFALWRPSCGQARDTALVTRVMLPEEGDRNVHGNVSFNPQYLERACRLACSEGQGLAFLHSHPFPGWQGMSKDDVAAEQRMGPFVEVLTGKPLLGMTTGSDGTWSARIWLPTNGRSYHMEWCHEVRCVGASLNVDFNDRLIPPPVFREMFKRTATVWGVDRHGKFARLRIGIVGLGSVGSLVAEALARMGMTRVVLIDFDEVQEHNLDRLAGATRDDIGKLKVEVAKRYMLNVATASAVQIREVPFSVAEPEGYRAALDCDVLFSCVDRPRARSILNHFAYAHLIPAIDGGIAVRFKNGQCSGADWQLQTAGPERPCLECLGAYNPSDVDTEKAGLLDDPSYLKNLPVDHHFKRNENVFPFSMNLASLEIFQLMALATGVARMEDFGVQRFRYFPGLLDADEKRSCKPNCPHCARLSRGDDDFSLAGRDITAERARKRQADGGRKTLLPFSPRAGRA